MRTGQARKRDKAERPIVKALRAHDIEVWPLSEPGLPDLLAWRRTAHPHAGRPVLLEVKGTTGRLTRAQLAYTGPRYVVRTPTEALAIFGITLVQ